MSLIASIDPNAEVLYSVVEVAKILRIGKNKVYELIYCGALPAIKIGGLKIRSSTLQQFLDKYEGYDLTDVNNIAKIELKPAC